MHHLERHTCWCRSLIGILIEKVLNVLLRFEFHYSWLYFILILLMDLTIRIRLVIIWLMLDLILILVIRLAPKMLIIINGLLLILWILLLFIHLLTIVWLVSVVPTHYTLLYGLFSFYKSLFLVKNIIL